MDAALASLLGALIGGGGVAGTDLLLDRGRAKREREAEEAKERREARRAARLLYEELDAGRRTIEYSFERSTYYWDPPKQPLPAVAWEARARRFRHPCARRGVAGGREGLQRVRPA